jgi:alpha-beta hydrolase superfamily lysophospholipase
MIAMPAPSSEETIVAADGVKLHVEHFTPSLPATGVLVFVHGFSAHIGNFGHLGRACADAGLETTMFDCRGHGRSQGRRGYVARFADFVDDLDLVVTAARARSPGLPIALAGHSHGAAVCLDYVLGATPRPSRAAPPAPVQVIALAAPFLRLKLRVPALKLIAAKVFGGVWPTLTMANGIVAEDVSRTPEALAGFLTDPLVHHVATPRWFNEIRGAQARLLAAASKLTVPTLLLIAGQDRLVSNEATFDFARSAGPIVQLKMYDNLFHEMFLEPERAEVIGDLVHWVKEKLGP